MPGWDGWIGVVAEHAVIADFSTDWQLTDVVAGIHGPGAAFFCVPRERKLDQNATGGAMQKSSDMVARAHDVIDLQILSVVRLTVITDLPASLNPASVSRDHLEPGSRRAVKIGLGVR